MKFRKTLSLLGSSLIFLSSANSSLAEKSFAINDSLLKQRVIIYEFFHQCEIDYPTYPEADLEIMSVFCEAFVTEGLNSESGTSYIPYSNPVASARFSLVEENTGYTAYPLNNHPGVGLTEYGERHVMEHFGEGIIESGSNTNRTMDFIKYREMAFETLLGPVFRIFEEEVNNRICVVTRPEDNLSGQALNNLTRELIRVGGGVIADEWSPNRGGIAFGYCPQYFNY